MTFAATSSVTAKGPGGKGGVPCRPVHHALGGRSARNFAHNARGSKSNQFKSIVSATDHSGSAFAALLPVEVAYLGGGSVLPTESPSFFFKVFFEVAFAEGEGTLVHHAVYRDDVNSHGHLFNVMPETTQVLVEQIDEARFSEFHEIHGGDRAV